MRTLTPVGLFFCLLSFLTGCSSEQSTPDDRHRFTVTAKNGIETAVTTGGPAFDGELFRYEHVLTLQEDEARAESLLSRPSVFTRDENGDHYVIDSAQKRIVVFDREGRYARCFGRRGEGPGEFRYMMLQYVRGGIVSIWDYMTGRLTRLHTDGTLHDIVRKPLDFEYVPRGVWRTDENGLVVMRPFLVGSDSTSVTVASYDAGDRLIATLQSPELFDTVHLMSTIVGRTVSNPIPFAPFPTATYRPGRGILVSPAHRPVLQWYDTRGELLSLIEIDCEDTLVTAEDQKKFTRLWADRLEEHPELSENIRTFGNTALLPQKKAAWTFIHIDDAGYYWLRCNDQPYLDYAVTEGYRYYLLSPEGEYLGITRTPPEQLPNEAQCHLIPVSVAHGYYMGISDDPDTGEKRLQVYRLVPEAEGFRYP